MNETYRFNVWKRLRESRYPLGLAVGVVLLLAWVRPGVWSWGFWAALVAAGLMSLRVWQHLSEGRHPLTVSDAGVTRFGRTVPFAGALVELRLAGRSTPPQAEQLLIWVPAPDGKGGVGVGFDQTLEGFGAAVSAILARVAEEKVVVTALGSGEVRDERREAVLSNYRPALTPAQKALAQMGRPGLGAPKLPN